MATAHLPPGASSSLALGAIAGLALAYLLRAYRLTSTTAPSCPPKSIPAPLPLPLPPCSSSPPAHHHHPYPHPYPPDALPGGRRVPTPYGTIQAYEFGPAAGEKVLFLPGIGTPVQALGDLARHLAGGRRGGGGGGGGYRVMLFDLFGRGYSDAPALPAEEDGEVLLPCDERLYVAQALLVLASSPLPWTGDDAFHLVGYSLGGGLAVCFARWFARMVRSVVCVAPGGLVRRRERVGWVGSVLYSRGWLPERLLEWLVERRIRPRRKGMDGRRGEVADDDGGGQVVGREGSRRDGDADGGDGWHGAVLSRRSGAGSTTVADVMEWQIREHRGFVKAFMSSIRYAPIYDRKEDWAALGRLLEERRKDAGMPGLRNGRVLLVLGTRDTVIVRDELVADATAALGEDGVEVVEVDAGHELAFTHGEEVADAAVRFWSEDGLRGSNWIVSGQAGTEEE